MILKFLLIAAVIALLYFLYMKSKKASLCSKKEAHEKKQKEKESANEMIECATCTIYCSLDDAILSSGKYYCSKECVEKAK